MKPNYSQQLVLTAVASKQGQSLDEIGAEIRKQARDISFKLMGEEILDHKDQSAEDFFLLQESDSETPADPMPLSEMIDRLYQGLRPFFVDRECDFCIQPYSPVTRRKKVIFSDMDSTLITNETLDDIAYKAGFGEEVARITRQGIEGDIDFHQSIEKRLSLFKGLDIKPLIDEVSKEIIYSPGAETLILTLTHFGVEGVLVTGGFDPLASQVRDKLGMKHLTCNRFDIKDNLATGTWAGELVTGEKKYRTMVEYLRARGMIAEQVLSVGDGYNDVPMLQAAGLGVAYRGTDRVRSMIPHQINFTDLTTLLYYQGYSNKEFYNQFNGN